MSIFNQIQLRKPKLNKFNLSHEKKLTMRMGQLVPAYIQEVLPGDKLKVNTEILVRLMPLLAPIYSRLNVKVDYFFVPNRLVWNKWEDFITGGENGNASPVFPYYEIGESNRTLIEAGKLPDYMGIPTPPTAAITQAIQFSALPFRAYQLIYAEYYRDQNLQSNEFLNIDLNAEGNVTTEFVNNTCAMRNRAWEKDYFTSAMNTPQKGGAVILPADVTYKLASIARDVTGNPLVNEAGIATGAGGELKGTTSNTGAIIDNVEGIDITVEDLRRSARLQEWLERNMRAGSRYVESLLAHFGVHNDDLRVMRPQYLGGFQNPVIISEVLSNFQFSGDAEGQPQGHMSGHGIAVGSGSGFTGSFKEHGYVFGLMSILPRTEYQQGLPKHFQRFDKLDFAWPSFAQLGEQPVRNSEVYFDYTGGTSPVGTFGYQSRYADYKYAISTVHGDFRESLAHWTTTRIFTTPPALNQSFIVANPTDRIYAVQDGTHELLINLHNSVSALRELPYFNTPTL